MAQEKKLLQWKRVGLPKMHLSLRNSNFEYEHRHAKHTKSR